MVKALKNKSSANKKDKTLPGKSMKNILKTITGFLMNDLLRRL